MWRRMERFYHCYLDIWFDSSLERAIELDGEGTVFLTGILRANLHSDT